MSWHPCILLVGLLFLCLPILPTITSITMSIPSTSSLCASLIAVCALFSGPISHMNVQHLPYPNTKEVNHIDTYFGTKVADPYRWLEDDNSAETKEWVDAENRVTFDYLSKIPYRPQIAARLKQLVNYPRY